MITVSVVSHNHGDMVTGVVRQLLTFPEVSEILVTLNVPESWPMPDNDKVQLIRNVKPKGFGANHNAAYRHSQVQRHGNVAQASVAVGPETASQSSQPFSKSQPSTDARYFCILNPDIEFNGNPFPALLACMQNTQAGIAAPAILEQGRLADSARYFPTLFSLFNKALGRNDGRYVYSLGDSPFPVDWVAGMFMVFSASAFERLRGFDEKYYLYYEDVDICARAHQLGLPVVLCPASAATHDARRTSRKSLRFMSWHLSSMARFLIKRCFCML